MCRPRGEGGDLSGADEQGSAAAHHYPRGSRQQHGAGPRQPKGQMGGCAGEGC